MRTGFCFEPGRFGQNRNRNGESLLVESQRGCSPVAPQALTADCRAPLHPLASAASGMSPHEHCQENLVGTDETCQRARIYFRKNHFSCARTDMWWPLPKSGLTRAPLTDPPDTVSSSISTKKQDAPNGCANEKLYSAPDGPFAGKAECGGGFLTSGNDKLEGKTSSQSPDSTKTGFAPNSFQGDEAGTSPPFSGHRSDCSGTSPSPSAAVLGDMERTSSSSSISPPLSCQSSSPRPDPKSWEKQMFVSEGARMISPSPSFAPAHSRDPLHSPESSLLLPPDKRDGDEELSAGPPHCCHVGSPTEDGNKTTHPSLYDALPPMLSPVTSPHRRAWKCLLSWSPGSSERKEHEEEEDDDIGHNKSPQLVNGNSGNSSVDPQHGFEGPGEVVKPAPLTGPQVPPSHENGTEPSSPSTCAEDGSHDALDEVTAYKQDILLVDVTQDDAELFENLPQKSLLKLGPVRFSEDLRYRPLGTAKKHQLNSNRASVELGQRSTPVPTNYIYDNADDTEESTKRPWRPQSSSRNSKTQSGARSVNDARGKSTDLNNNEANKSSERTQPLKSTNPLHSHNPAALTPKNGPCASHSASEFRRQKSNSYCWKYFSEVTRCGYNTCRFQHVPLDGDEKFCIEVISRFTKNPTCLHKAQAVFTSYYLNNPPGVCFSMPMLLSLLWALLKAGMVSEIFSVLNVSLAYKIVPGHEFVLALFNFVREKGPVSLLPELMQLSVKMAAAGLVLNFGWTDGLPNNGEVQPAVCTNSNFGKGTASGPCQGYLNVARVVVEIELCTKLEDWRRMGGVFMSVCQATQRPNQLEQISGHVAVALLSESKDKQAVPFAAFAETVCQKEQDHITKTYLGRIGVSLMLRYHKTHQWAKGRRVAEVLSFTKIEYPTLKGLFGNEDGASRCFLVTMAAELFLLSGNIEGALNTLRENSWFLSSSSWPCEPADVESRIRVSLRLAEKTSDKVTLEILCNLPGLKEPNDFVNISSYCSVFNAHLLVCVDRQALPVASDLADLMLAKRLPVDPTSLHALLQKLGKQNLWLRARELFKHSLSQGYYQGMSAPPGFMALTLPCQLEEVELVLAFEMFITVNGSNILHAAENTTNTLSITLKRTQSGESEYLSAGSRLLSAASIPQPKLIIHYTAVNSSQEQVFAMDISSARSWLRHNHLWANKVWAH